MAVVGDLIFLDYQLHDYTTDKFVRATIKADGVEIITSPVPVPHVVDGAHFFKHPDLVFPSDTSEVSILYSVYSDSGLTNRLKRYGAGRDTYRLSSALSSNENDNALLRQADIEVSIEEIDEVEVHMVDDQENIEVSIEEIDEIEVYMTNDQENIEVVIEEIEEIIVTTEGS